MDLNAPILRAGFPKEDMTELMHMSTLEPEEMDAYVKVG